MLHSQLRLCLNEYKLIELHSGPNISTLCCSVSIRGDLMLQLIHLRDDALCQEGKNMLWQIATITVISFYFFTY